MTRRCGHCTLCCRLTPVVELKKRGGTRCAHQRHTGCAIYAKRPLPCRAWSCRWLEGDDTADQRRPDFSHCVIDMMPDYVTAIDEDGGRFEVPVVQIWVDPRHPEAWRAREIVAYIERRGHEGFGAIIRYDESLATVVFPPSLTGTGWVEKTGPGMRETAHSQRDIAAVLTEVTGEPYGVGEKALGRIFEEERP